MSRNLLWACTALSLGACTQILGDDFDIGGPPGGPGDCGNGVVDPGEACDGDDLGGHDCLSEDFSGGELACTACELDTSACTSVCGDGDVAGDEACDDGDVEDGDG